jgi:multicomponent Na+:H+ antiporter subunit D
VVSLLTLYALVKAWNKAFWQTPPVEPPRTPLPLGMLGPTAALVALGLLLTVAAGPLYGYTERAALTLQDRSVYIASVLPDGERGEGESADVAEDAEEAGRDDEARAGDGAAGDGARDGAGADRGTERATTDGGRP